MTMVIKKVMRNASDLDEMCEKVRQVSKKRWRVTYSTDKEDRLSTTVIAETYTGAYLAFMDSFPDTYVVDILEV